MPQVNAKPLRPDATSGTAAWRVCPLCGGQTVARCCEVEGAPTVRPVGCDAASIGPGALLDGKVRIVEVIGVGGFAKVYGAIDEHTHAELAVKVMSKAYIASDPDNICRFVSEAEITSRLTHGNTIRVYDVGQTADGQLILIMERLRGHSLTQRIRDLRQAQQRMPIDEAAQIAIGVLNSLVEAHASGLVHRDLKPDNIFLHRAGERGRIVKVIDFGIAHREGSEMTKVGQALGTPAYMSPEQARGQSIDGRADLYAVGVILYQLLTGGTPFPEVANPLMTMMHHVLTPVPDLRAARPEASPALAALVTQALAKEPARRFADAAEMRMTLRSVVGASPVVSAGPTRAELGPVGDVRSGGPPRLARRALGTSTERRAPRTAAEIAVARAHASARWTDTAKVEGDPLDEFEVLAPAAILMIEDEPPPIPSA